MSETGYELMRAPNERSKPWIAVFSVSASPHKLRRAAFRACRSKARISSVPRPTLRQPSATKAWERFVELYTPLLFHWARRLGLQESDAADLVQDILATLLEELPRFEYQPDKRFRGWLWTVTLNRFRERRRTSSSDTSRRRSWSI